MAGDVGDPRMLVPWFERRVRTVTVGTSSTELATRDYSRVFLSFSNPSPNDLWIQPVNPATLSAGMRLTQSQPDVRWYFAQAGPLVGEAWNAVAAFGNIDALVVEVFYRPPLALGDGVSPQL